MKVGDKVRCIKSCLAEAVTEGKIYVVEQYKTYSSAWDSITVDDGTQRLINHATIRPLFELVKDNRITFKPGDRVRALKTSASKGFNEGNTYIVKGHRAGDCVMIEKDDNGSRTNGWHADAFELVSSQSELHVLVDQVNLGCDAHTKLHKEYADKIEDYESHRDHQDVYYKVRIKPQTKKFRVASWDAEITDWYVKIGCQIFDKKELIGALNTLIEGKAYQYVFSDGKTTLSSTRNAIVYDTHRITWEQAEQLLKELVGK